MGYALIVYRPLWCGEQEKNNRKFKKWLLSWLEQKEGSVINNMFYRIHVLEPSLVSFLSQYGVVLGQVWTGTDTGMVLGQVWTGTDTGTDMD